jgi:hypothetical protein
MSEQMATAAAANIGLSDVLGHFATEHIGIEPNYRSYAVFSS